MSHSDLIHQVQNSWTTAVVCSLFIYFGGTSVWLVETTPQINMLFLRRCIKIYKLHQDKSYTPTPTQTTVYVRPSVLYSGPKHSVWVCVCPPSLTLAQKTVFVSMFVPYFGPTPGVCSSIRPPPYYIDFRFYQVMSPKSEDNYIV